MHKISLGNIYQTFKADKEIIKSFKRNKLILQTIFLQNIKMKTESLSLLAPILLRLAFIISSVMG